MMVFYHAAAIERGFISSNISGKTQYGVNQLKKVIVKITKKNPNQGVYSEQQVAEMIVRVLASSAAAKFDSFWIDMKIQ